MNLTKLTMRRPVSVFIILLALIVFGVQAMLGAPLELIPEMEMPIMIVMSSYPGAGPGEAWHTGIRPLRPPERYR